MESVRRPVRASLPSEVMYGTCDLRGRLQEEGQFFGGEQGRGRGTLPGPSHLGLPTNAVV